MSVTLKIDFEQVLTLVGQLSQEEQDRLIRELNKTDEKKAKQTEPESYHEAIKRIQEQTRGKLTSPKKSNEELYQSLIRFPVLSEEEIQAMESAGKELNECRLASLLTPIS